MGGKCEGSICKPLKLADIPNESARTIGLSRDYVLVSGTSFVSGEASIFTVSKQNGTVNRTRPPRDDGSYSSRLVGTATTLVAADVFTPGVALYFLSHCAIADCSTTIPPAGSGTFDGIHDFAFDSARGKVFWFDTASSELMTTSADAWVPTSLGPATVIGPNTCRTMAQGNGRVFAVFDYGVYAIPEDGTPTPEIVSGVPPSPAIDEVVATPEALVMLLHSGTLVKAPLPAGIANRLPDEIAGISGVTSITAVGATLFWSKTSTIYKCDLPLCAQPVPIAQDAAVVADIVAEDRAVYWLSEPYVTGATISVMRVAL
jgi:hypothetical protein